MPRKLQSYLRTERKRKGFSQEDIAFLLGCQNGSVVSRFERLAREPNIETAFACQVIFGVPAHELFPGKFKKVEKRIINRAALLSKKLGADNSRDALRKRAVLDALISQQEEQAHTLL